MLTFILLTMFELFWYHSLVC